MAEPLDQPLKEGAGAAQDILQTYQSAAAEIGRQIGPELQGLQPVRDPATGQDLRTPEQVARANTLMVAAGEMGQAASWFARQSVTGSAKEIPQHVLDIIHRNYQRVLGVPFTGQAAQQRAKTPPSAAATPAAAAASTPAATPAATAPATPAAAAAAPAAAATLAAPAATPPPTATPTPSQPAKQPQRSTGLRARIGAVLSRIGRRAEWRGKKLPIDPETASRAKVARLQGFDNDQPYWDKERLAQLAAQPATGTDQSLESLKRIQEPDEHPFLAATRREMEQPEVRQQAERDFQAAQSAGFQDIPREHRRRAAHDPVQHRAMTNLHYRPGHESDEGIGWQDAIPGFDPKNKQHQRQQQEIQQRYAEY
jgi:hypothetical protein